MVPVAANSGGIVYYHYIIKLSRLVQKCRVRVPKRGGMSVQRIRILIRHVKNPYPSVNKTWLRPLVTMSHALSHGTGQEERTRDC